MTKQQKYPTNLTDEQVEFIKQFLPPSSGFGRPPLEIAQILNALFYVVVGGIGWRMLPKDFPNWKTVYHYFWRMAQERRLEATLPCSAPVGTVAAGTRKRGERGQS